MNRGIVAFIIVAASVGAISLGVYLKPGEVDAVPNPRITNPLNSGLLYDPLWKTTIVSQENVIVQAVESNLAGDIVSTLFEYSTDETSWISIGTDNYGGFEGDLVGEWDDRKIGKQGWSSFWDLSGLAEGTYYIRATMTDEAGQTGQATKVVYYDPVPPVPKIYEPSYAEKISGLVEFKVETDATDIVSMELVLIHGSDNWYNQTGVGTLDGHNVGGGKGTCSPTAAANALAGLGDNNLYPPGQEENDEALAEALCDAFGTDANGTPAFNGPIGINQPMRTDGIESGLMEYLENRGVGCSNENGYEITTYHIWIARNPATGGWYPIPGSNEIDFEDYNNELRKNEAVIISIRKWDPGADGEYGTEDDTLRGGHSLTGSGASSTPNATGENPIGFVDPNGGTVENSVWGSTGGFSYIEYPPGSLESCIVTGMWAISPKTENASVMNTDYSPEDGWATMLDTTEVEDGFHTLMVRMTDAQGHVGTQTIVVEVKNEVPANQPPMANFTYSPSSPTTYDAIQFTDTSTDPDGNVVSWNWLFGDDSYSELQNPQHQYSENMTYTVTLTVTDDQGATDEISYQITVEGDNTPPVTTKEVGEPNWEGGTTVTGFTPISLSAVDEGSGVDNIYFEVWWDSDNDGDVDTQVGEESVENDTVTIYFSDWEVTGSVELRWFAVDKAGNHEKMQTQKHYVL